jgi:hypothetical protein
MVTTIVLSNGNGAVDMETPNYNSLLSFESLCFIFKIPETPGLDISISEQS